MAVDNVTTDANDVISYLEMCRREGVSLQRGMNFSLGGTHSVILMSVRAGAPYDDRLEDDGTTLIYEGHDEPKTRGGLLTAARKSPRAALKPVFTAPPNPRFTSCRMTCTASNRA